MHSVQAAAAEHVTHFGISSEHNWHFVLELIAYKLLTQLVHAVHDEHVTQLGIGVLHVTHRAGVCLQ